MEWYERGEKANGEDEREAVNDLHQLLGTTYGYRFMLRLLLSLGAEGRCPTDEYSIALRNKAEDLLVECGQASYKTMIQLISDIRSIKYGRDGSSGGETRDFD